MSTVERCDDIIRLINEMQAGAHQGVGHLTDTSMQAQE